MCENIKVGKQRHTSVANTTTFSYLFTGLHFCKAMWIAYQYVQGWPDRYKYLVGDNNKC